VLAVGWMVTHLGGDRPGPARAEPSPSVSVSTPASRGAPDVRYLDVAGLQLPVSLAAGPHVVRDGQAGEFAHTDLGAAFAAVHLLVRTFPFVGSAVFGPTIAEQVVGPDAPALTRLTTQAYLPAARAAKVQNGGALRSEGGWVAGYRLDPPEQVGTPHMRTVHVLLHQSDGPDGGGFVEYRVQITWQNGDWRLVAPAWGDWRTAARAMTSADRSRFRSYDQAVDQPGLTIGQSAGQAGQA
jgi:hypothetical protein